MLAFKGITKNEPATEAFNIEHDGLALAMHESFTEFEDLRGGLPEAFSNIYEAVQLGNNGKTQEENLVVMEGAVGEAWQRIKNWFVKVGEKIKGWFENVVKFFKSIFMSNKAFLEKYEGELKSKDAGKFSYKGHQWKESKMEEWSKKVASCRNEAEGAFKEAIDSATASTDPGKDNKGYKIAEKKKAIDQKLGVKSVGQFKEKMIKETRGGDKRDIRGFSVKSVDAMIAYISDESNAIKDLQENVDCIKDASAKYAEEVEDAMGKYKEGESDHGKRASVASYLANAAAVARYHISYETAALEVKKSLIHEMVGEFSGALRQFVRYSPKKESYVPETAGEGVQENVSVLDAFMSDI